MKEQEKTEFLDYQITGIISIMFFVLSVITTEISGLEGVNLLCFLCGIFGSVVSTYLYSKNSF
jgi:hypothetical protein